MSEILRFGRFVLAQRRPLVMGIVNLTPDSFSGDGHGHHLDAALHHAEQLVAGGADLLDIGGESSRPGAQPVAEQEELDRVMPLVERLAAWPVPISVDTVKPAVMRAAIAAGAAMINDINAFRAEGAFEAVVNSSAALCIMHMKGEPRSMQQNPEYEDVVSEVAAFLAQQKARFEQAGVARERLVVDPGFGFGKTLAHNLALFRALPELGRMAPLLVGVSRKSMIGAITGRSLPERASGSVAAAMMAADRGARLLRVHDVRETVDALKVRAAVLDEEWSAQEITDRTSD